MTKVHVDLCVEVYHLLYDGFDLVKPTNDIAWQLCLSGPPKMTRIGRTSVKCTNDEAGMWLVIPEDSNEQRIAQDSKWAASAQEWSGHGE